MGCLKHKFFSCIVLALIFALPVTAIAKELTISAAASLTNAFLELKQAFTKLHPDCQVYVNFAASNPLLKQIQEGAPVDVFASADQETMDRAQKSHVIDPDTRQNFVRNTLVLIVPMGKNKITLKDLPKMQRIAIGNPASVPAGRYAKAALEADKLFTSLSSKFIYGTNVRQVLDYVARGEVDCGIVYGTDAAIQKDKVVVCEILNKHQPILYPIAVATTGKNPADAKAFIDFVLSPAGSLILEKYGFAKP
ncbi:MAG: molybdate ABC transporter substrate-binding protein [Desulfovibrionaceae bacterium]|nr:molybdate ABC transporter substrate-binding protein [Desulfovibrionaceae bacterium]